SMIIGARSTVRFANPLIALVAAVLVIGAAGCAGTDTEEDRLVRDVTEAYQTAKRAMQSQNYRRAIPIYEALQARFPFSDLSRRIQLELMFAYYKSGRTEQSIDLADQFMRENPTHPEVDYALYIKALNYFN